jgi:3-hydroxyacyl-CoA dehydrogenase
MNPVSDIEIVAVIGVGQMGRGIAQVVAQTGCYRVVG